MLWLAYLCGLSADDTESDLLHMVEVVFILASYLTDDSKLVVCLKDESSAQSSLTVCGDCQICMEIMQNILDIHT